MNETCAAHPEEECRPDAEGGGVGTAAEALGSVIARSAACLRNAGVADPVREARLLVAYALDLSLDALLRLGRDAPVPTARPDAVVARRAAREPLAFITGLQGFWSLDLAVSPATLIPRADTESVVEAALDAWRDGSPSRVLDLGAGCGAILLALLVEWREAFGVGLDRSEGACALARMNAERASLATRSAFVCADWDAPLDRHRRYDVVVSNPPYIPSGDISGLMPEVARFEPRLALDGGRDGLDSYRRLVPAVARLLAPAGCAVFEIGAGQEQDLAVLAAEAGLRVAALRTDAGGHVRAVTLRLR